MKSAPRFFNKRKREKIEAALHLAQAKTAIRIVPAVATSSSPYQRAEDILALILGLIFALLTFALIPKQSDELGAWGGWSITSTLLVTLGALLVGSFIALTLARHTPTLKRLFTSITQTNMATQTAAGNLLNSLRLHPEQICPEVDEDTDASEQQATDGQEVPAYMFLIYISLFEKNVLIQSDPDTAALLGPDAMQQLADQLAEGLRSDSPTEILIDIINAAADLLEIISPEQNPSDNNMPAASLLLVN